MCRSFHSVGLPYQSRYCYSSCGSAAHSCAHSPSPPWLLTRPAAPSCTRCSLSPAHPTIHPPSSPYGRPLHNCLAPPDSCCLTFHTLIPDSPTPTSFPHCDTNNYSLPLLDWSERSSSRQTNSQIDDRNYSPPDCSVPPMASHC